MTTPKIQGSGIAQEGAPRPYPRLSEDQKARVLAEVARYFALPMVTPRGEQLALFAPSKEEP
jgi:hypothetical protein